MMEKKTITKAREVYKEILDLVRNNKDVCFYDISDMETKSKKHLFGLELRDKYGLNIDPERIHYTDWHRVDDYRFIGWYGEKYQRTISWEDNGKQPEDELLLVIQFPTGAYIFSDDYPVELFKEFWMELKSYEPKYVDTHNNGLFFAIDDASKVFNEFENIYEKYQDKNREEWKMRKAQKLREELDKLEKETNHDN